MSNANIAYLILVGCSFAAFMITLGYGYIRCALPERRSPAPRRSERPEPLRKAA
jgi:hypothetical protein